jgi:hypothetical protein
MVLRIIFLEGLMKQSNHHSMPIILKIVKESQRITGLDEALIKVEINGK